MQPMTAPHPVQFEVDYPDRQLGRLSTLLRALCHPDLVVALLGGPAFGAAGDSGGLFFIGSPVASSSSHEHGWIVAASDISPTRPGTRRQRVAGA